MKLPKFFNFQLKPKGADERVKVSGSVIDLFGDIDDWWGVNLKWFKSQLEEMNGKPITVRIHSSGGSFFEGIAIANLLRQYPGVVTTINNGLVASAATFPFLAGDRRYIAPAGMTMIHEVSAGVFGRSADMRKTADLMDSINDSVAELYAHNTGKPETKATFRELMNEETWLNAEQAVALGFAHGLLNNRQIQNAYMEKAHNPQLDALIAHVMNHAAQKSDAELNEVVDTQQMANQIADVLADKMRDKLAEFDAALTELRNKQAELESSLAELAAKKVTPQAGGARPANALAGFADEIAELFTAKISE